jgi:hypothetical protein
MDRNELLKKVAYLTDNVNKKIRAFRKEEAGNFYEHKLNYVTASIDKKINLTMESGFLTKSKRELNKLTTKELNKLYEGLRYMQTNDVYGNIKKYKTYETTQLNKTASTMQSILGKEKFNALLGDKSMNDFVKEFAKRLNEEREKKGKTYGSKQELLQMAIELPTSEDEKKEYLRTAESMEKQREMMMRNTVQMEGRRKNGNRN